jgi:glycosyltransferase involved in cell wall biosynthesis
LADTVEHGRTGYLVPDVSAMAQAILSADAINPSVCRAVARERFSLDRMVGAYFDVYERLASAKRPAEGAA